MVRPRAIAKTQIRISTKMKEITRHLLIGELRQLLEDLKKIRSTQVTENETTTRSDYLAKRVALAREKLGDLKSIQTRDKEVRDRHRKIEQDNAHRD